MQGMQALSDTEDALEEVYMDALEQLQNKRQEEKGAYRNLQREMEEYYALWVHQIKTPISAMRLLLQREEQKQTDPDETAGMEKSVLYDMQQELFWINQYVNMALQYQRMNSGMNDLVLEMVSADQVVRTAIRRFALIMIRKRLPFTMRNAGRWCSRMKSGWNLLWSRFCPMRLSTAAKIARLQYR